MSKEGSTCTQYTKLFYCAIQIIYYFNVFSFAWSINDCVHMLKYLTIIMALQFFPESLYFSTCMAYTQTNLVSLISFFALKIILSDINLPYWF